MKKRTAIKRAYQDTWFAVPKVLVEAYMPTIGLEALAIYIILSCYQDQDGQISNHIRLLHAKSGVRHMKILHLLQYLDRMRLVSNIDHGDKRVTKLTFSPAQPIIKSNK